MSILDIVAEYKYPWVFVRYRLVMGDSRVIEIGGIRFSKNGCIFLEHENKNYVLAQRLHTSNPENENPYAIRVWVGDTATWAMKSDILKHEG